MDAVIKIGGSLLRHPPQLRLLGDVITRASKKHKVIVVPGGSIFADTIREIDKQYSLSATAAHWMAIYAMNQYAYLLSTVIENGKLYERFSELQHIFSNGLIPIFLPAKYLIENDHLPHSWSVTSDTIALDAAIRAGFPTLILVKDVDGVFNNNPNEGNPCRLLSSVKIQELERRKACVDDMFPRYFAKTQLSCHVINGLHPERLISVLNGKHTIGTRIVS
ncbi:MAG: amino acid kinase family protein [Candidatus Ranarchaeia archaeon]